MAIRRPSAESGRSPLPQSASPPVTTVLDKELKRQISVDGADYTVALDPDGIRLTGKGKRKAEVTLRWHELLNGDAAMAMALNASLSHPSTHRQPAPTPHPEPEPPPKKTSRRRP